MKPWITEILTIVKKELKHCSRERNVQLFILFPPLFYALAVLAGAAVVSGMAGAEEHYQYKIAVAADDHSPFIEAVRSVLSSEKKISLINCPDPRRAVYEKTAEAAIVLAPADERKWLYNSCNYHSLEAKRKLETIFDKTRTNEIKHALTGLGLPENANELFEIKHVFSNKVKSAGKTPNKSPEDEAAMHMVPYLFWLSLVFGLAIAAAGTMHPAVCMFVEEREKKTLETTLLLPVTRRTLIAGKLLAVGIFSCILAVLNSLYFLLLLTMIDEQLKIIGVKETVQVILGVLSPPIALAVIITVLLSSSLCASVFMLFTVVSQSFNEAENLGTIPLLACGLIPLVGALPVLELNRWTAFIPFVNSTLSLKSCIIGQSFRTVIFGSWCETLLITMLIIAATHRLLQEDSFFFGNASNARFIKGFSLRRKS